MSRKILILGHALLVAEMCRQLEERDPDIVVITDRPYSEGEQVMLIDEVDRMFPAGSFHDVYGPPSPPKPIELKMRYDEPFPEYSAKSLHHPGFDGNYRGYFKRARKKRW
jgi:hypothetical protein